MRLSLDISTKNCGLALINIDDNSLEYVNLIEHSIKAKDNMILRITRNTKFIQETIETMPWDQIKEVVIEMTPIPGYSGRVLVLFVGIYLAAVCNRPIDFQIKICKPLDWQDIAFGTNITRKGKLQRGDIKRISMEVAYENNLNFKDRDILLESNDVADAVNMGQVWEDLPDFSIGKEWQNWSNNGKKKRRKK